MTDQRDEILDEILDSDTPLASGLLPRRDETRAWSMDVNGRSLPELIGEPVRTLSIDCVRNPLDPDGTRLGRVEYGAEPGTDGSASKYDTFLFHELGGASTIAYGFINGELFVSVVQQYRFAERHPIYNPSGRVFNVPRGLHDPDNREGSATARDELVQEVGPVPALGPIVRLPGANCNMNNAWLKYEDALQGGVPVQGGVSFHAVEVDARQLYAIDAETYKMAETVSAGRPPGSAYEKIAQCLFIDWQAAVKLRDGFTPIAVMRLLVHLTQQGRAQVAFY